MIVGENDKIIFDNVSFVKMIIKMWSGFILLVKSLFIGLSSVEMVIKLVVCKLVFVGFSLKYFIRKFGR